MKIRKIYLAVIIMGVIYTILISLWTWKLVTFCYDAVSSAVEEDVRRCVQGSTTGTPIIAFVSVTMAIVFIIMAHRKKEVK